MEIWNLPSVFLKCTLYVSVVGSHNCLHIRYDSTSGVLLVLFCVTIYGELQPHHDRLHQQHTLHF